MTDAGECTSALSPMNVIFEDAMARYSEHDTSKIHQAADAFRANCLLIDGSLLFSDASVWRPDVLDRIHKAFVATFDESNRYFVAKLIKAEA